MERRKGALGGGEALTSRGGLDAKNQKREARSDLTRGRTFPLKTISQKRRGRGIRTGAKRKDENKRWKKKGQMESCGKLHGSGGKGEGRGKRWKTQM